VLAILHELVPKAVRVAALVNPANATNKPRCGDVHEAARAIGHYKSISSIVGGHIVVVRDHFVHIPAFSIATSCPVERSTALSSFVDG
jgi:hypothetical protein